MNADSASATALQAIRDAVNNLKGQVSDTALALVALEEIIPADPLVAGVVSISDVTTVEGDTDQKVVQAIVTRQGGTAAFDVSYETLDGTAVAGEDYTGASGTLSFADDEMEKAIPLGILGDSKAEGDESFTVRLIGPTNGAEIIHGEAVIQVNNDDFAGVVSVADASRVEGGAGTSLLVFKLTRTGGTAPFEVDFATSDGTAVAGQDYVASSGRLSFARGQNELAITIAVAGDTIVEGDEVMSLDISDPSNGATLGNARATGTIINDDVATPPPPPPGSALSVRLDFTDGKSLSFSQDKATDLGDYVGPFVHQKCFRQIASGNGDYRDAFLVDFRPDADGKRQEVVVEFGTLFKFPVGASPQVASGVTPLHLGIPPAPMITRITAGAALARSLVLALTYVTPDGETPASTASIALLAGERAVVKSPPAGMNATHYNVSLRIPGGKHITQNANPIPLGQDWTEPEAGVLLVGRALPFMRPTSVAYRATISGGDIPNPVTVTVPAHYWRSRWRWESAPRPIVRSLADLVAARAVLPLTKELAYGAKLPARRAWAGPMDNGPVYQGMSGPGGRPDIGFLTEWAAAFLVTGDANCEATMRTAAEASGTMDFWTRDAGTGTFVNTSTVPRVPSYNDAFHGPQSIPSVPGDVYSWSFIYPNESHMPALGFAPWMVTDDPYYLEGAQAVANYGIMEGNGARNAEKLPSLGSTATPRSWAWNLRDFFQLAGWSLEAAPSWLLPRSHWRGLLPQQLTYAMKYVNATASPCTTVFGLLPFVNNLPAFMLDYICIVMGWCKWTGKFPEFDPVAEYATRSRIAMSDPSDSFGWDHRVPEPYYMPVADANKGVLSGDARRGDPGYKVAASPDTPTSFAELFKDYLIIAPSKKWPADPTTWPADGFAVKSNGYYVWIRSALAALSLAGIPKARQGHDFTKRQLDAYHQYGSNGFTWAISPE